MAFKKLTDEISVAAQINEIDITFAEEMGFKTIICNRPDGEDPGQPSAEEIADLAGNAGMTFVHQPVMSGNVTFQDVAEFGELMSQMEKPILAYCRSGTRCSTLWALSEAATRDIDDILNRTANAGYDYSGMRSTLESLKQNSAE